MKNWVPCENIKYQDQQPSENWVSVEDLVEERAARAWANMLTMAPMFTQLSYEVLENLRQQFFGALNE